MCDASEVLQAMKKAYVEGAFIRTADHNYLMARLAFARSLASDGYWMAAQCVEKYLKACLLLNGVNVKSFSHDIVALSLKHREIVAEAMPKEFLAPAHRETSVLSWGSSSVGDFLAGLNVFGSADNRYSRVGYQYDSMVSVKLDQYTYFVRRTCRPEFRKWSSENDLLSWEIGPTLPIETWSKDNLDRTAIDFFDGNGIWRSIQSGENVPSEMRPLLALQVSAIQSARMLAERAGYAQLEIEFFGWLLENVYLSKRDRQSLQGAIETSSKSGSRSAR